MKERLVSEVKKLLLVLTLGFLYYFIVSGLGAAVPCVFNRVTGLLCPACGVTRMAEAMARLDFSSAYGYNRVLFLTWPLIAGIFAAEEIRYIKSGKRNMCIISKAVLWIEIIVLIVFGIVRNIT